MTARWWVEEAIRLHGTTPRGRSGAHALAGVHVVEKCLQGRDPLRYTGFDDLPFVRREHPGNGVQRKVLHPGMVEGDALSNVVAGERVGAVLQRSRR